MAQPCHGLYWNGVPKGRSDSGRTMFFPGWNGPARPSAAGSTRPPGHSRPLLPGRLPPTVYSHQWSCKAVYVCIIDHIRQYIYWFILTYIGHIYIHIRRSTYHILQNSIWYVVRTPSYMYVYVCICLPRSSIFSWLQQYMIVFPVYTGRYCHCDGGMYVRMCQYM